MPITFGTFWNAHAAYRLIPPIFSRVYSQHSQIRVKGFLILVKPCAGSFSGFFRDLIQYN